MLGNDTSPSTTHKGRSGNWPVVLLVLFKGLRAWALFTAFKLLNEVPLLLYVFLVFFGSSVFFLSLQRPWSGSRHLNGRQWIRVFIYALLLTVSGILWNFGLKHYGPIRTILSADYADVTMYHALGALTVPAFIQSAKGQGALLVVFSCVMLFLFGSTPSLGPIYDSPYVGPIDAGKMGGIALFFSIGLTIFRKGITRRLYGDIGGTKRLFSMAMGVSTCILFPLGMYQLFTEPVEIDSAVLLSLLMVILFTVVADYYVEAISAHQLDATLSAPSTITAGFIVGWLISWIYGFEGVSWLEWLCFSFIVAGMSLLFGKNIEATLPVYSSGSTPISPGQGAKHTFSVLKIVIRQILEKSASRRIFGFLVINLMFMWVELMYGIWTNSLGLITDAFHMLFDCTALFIALFAEVISQWDGNNVFSYGYGRVQVLSGFANGIFLVFISFYVLMESIERFMEPPDVKTDRLLLVSILGFAVNMVGVFSFHDHHDHGDGHSHSHGHSHGEGKKKKDKSKDTHEHGHSHSHGHEHEHEHGHEHKHEHEHERKHEHEHGHEHGHDHMEHNHGHDHGHSHSHEKQKHKHNKHNKHKQESAHSHEHSENLQGVFLHLLADTLGSVGVIISSFIIQVWGWTLADPICSFFIAVLIFLSTIPLLKSASRTLLQCTPSQFEPILQELLFKIIKIEGVIGYSDPHFWNYANNIIVGSIHIQVHEDTNQQQILQIVSNMFKKKGVEHLAVEIEKPLARNATPTIHLEDRALSYQDEGFMAHSH